MIKVKKSMKMKMINGLWFQKPKNQESNHHKTKWARKKDGLLHKTLIEKWLKAQLCLKNKIINNNKNIKSKVNQQEYL